jgi:phage virion morphogenesis protein
MAKTFNNGDVKWSLKYNFNLDKWEKKLTTTLRREFLRKSDRYLHNELLKRFTSQKGPDGRAWPKLSKLTTKRKGHSRKLFYSGELMHSFKTSFEGDRLVVGTDVPYAKIQQEGLIYLTTKKQSAWMWHNLFNRTGSIFARRRVKIPARPFFGFSKKNISDLQKIMKDLIKESERLGR